MQQVNPDSYFEFDEPEPINCHICHVERSPHNVDWVRIANNDVPLCRACYNQFNLKTKIK